MTDPIQIKTSLREWVETATHRAMRDQARYVKSLGFSMPQFFLLMRVYYRKQCGISDLSEHMEITAAAASQTVDKLVQGGFLERTEDPNDRRAKQVTLSPKGLDLIEWGFAERFRWVDEMERNLSDEDRRKVGETLAILAEASHEDD